MTNDQLTTIQARALSATPVSGVYHHASGAHPYEDERDGLGLDLENGWPEPQLRGTFSRAADAHFHAHAREDVLALAAEVQQQRGNQIGNKELAKLQTLRDKIRRGEWRVNPETRDRISVYTDEGRESVAEFWRTAEMKYVLALHDALPALIAEIGRLRAIVEDAYQIGAEAVPYMGEYLADRYHMSERLGEIKAALAEARGEAYPQNAK